MIERGLQDREEQEAVAAPTERALRRICPRDRPPVTLRHAVPDDVLLLADLYYSLSDQARYLRYMRPLPRSAARAWDEGRRMARRAPGAGLTLIGIIQPGKFAEAVAVAELVRDPARLGHMELAVLVRDDYLGRGVGSAIGRELVALAPSLGVARVHAAVLPENRAALRLLARLGAPYTTIYDGGVFHAVISPGAHAPEGVGLGAAPV
jgi:RimJ/RimL family protein N-acetyltransferase